MSPSKILFFLSLSFVAGILLESVIKIPQITAFQVLWVFLLVVFLTAIIFILMRKDTLVVVMFCLLFLVLGILRLQISEFNIQDNKLSKFNNRGQVILTGTISDEPDVRDTYQMVKVSALGSTVLVTTKRYPDYRYLDKIKITGKLETPSVSEDFNYKDYLLKDHIYSVMAFPKIEVVSTTHQYNVYSYIYEKIIFLKQGLRRSIQNNFLPPQSSILLGTILGNNGAMSQDLKNRLNITGLRHLIAVSGSHVVVLISMITALALAIGMWRTQAFYISLTFIWVFIILTGLSAAAIRAGIMGGAYLLAQQLGRQIFNSRIIILAAALMLFINPLLLFYDVGFQLSFLAVLGLMCFEPFVRAFIKFLIKKFFGIKVEEKQEGILMLLSVSIAAQIFTLPIMIFNFGIVSWVSVIANILVLPIFYYVMLLGFLSSSIGMFWGGLGWIISIPCYFLLSYFIWVINFFSQPWMAHPITNVSWVWLLLSYVALGLGTWFLNKRYGQKFI